MANRLSVINILRKSEVECYTRKEWGSYEESRGSYARRGRTHPMPPGPAPYHFIHITVTRDTDTVREGKEGAQQIERYGYSSPPMVSYQDLITNEGKYFQGQDYGTKGTHTVNDKNVSGFPHNLNLHGYALALMQNVQDEITDEQVRLAAMVFAARELSGWVKKGAKIYPHRKFAWKSCPGDKAMARLPEIQKLKDQFVKNGLPNQEQEEGSETVGKNLRGSDWHVFANVGRGAKFWKIREAFVRVWVFSNTRGIVGFAEIDEGDEYDEHGTLYRIFGRPWQRDRSGWKSRVPILFNGLLWKKSEENQVFLTPGIAGVTPHRVLNEVVLTHRWLKNRTHVRMNTHWVPGAWNANERQRAEDLREEYWLDSIEKVRERVRHWHFNRKLDVVLSGDFNRQKTPWIHKEQVLAVKDSVDAIIAIPAPGRLAKIGLQRKQSLGIDFHKAIGAQILFEDAA